MDLSVLQIINGTVSNALEDISTECTLSFETIYMSSISAALHNTIQPFITSLEQVKKTDLYNAKSEIKVKKEAFIEEDNAYNAEEYLRNISTITSASNKGTKASKK